MSAESQIRKIEFDSTQVPYLAEYFGHWAMLEPAFRGLVDTAIAINLPMHMQSVAAIEARSRTTPATTNSQANQIAVMELNGPLMKHRSSMGGGTSTVEARRELRMLAKDPTISAIILQIDSPGGTVAGTMDLAAEVAAAARQKPVIAYIEDLGASAAYWIASQATEVHANASALVGSIGTYGVVHDLSKAAENQGIMVHVVRAGEFKGAGVPGTAVTDSQLAEVQRTVDSLNEHFLSGVAAGRNLSMDQTKQLADGRVHAASGALQLGLIDAVSSFDAVLNRAVELSSASGPMAASSISLSSDKEKTMSETTAAQEPKAATIAELEQACVGASAEFILSQVKSGATAEHASQAWINEQLAAAKAENQRLQDEVEQAKKASSSKPLTVIPKNGLPPVSVSHSVAAGTALDQWRMAYAAEMRECNSPPKAIEAVDRKYPGLRQQMIEEDNAAV